MSPTVTSKTLCMALLARDEEEMIGPHLAYHHALGVERAWVFVDRCRDRTAEIADRFPWVTVVERDRRPEDRHLSAHQTRVLGEALERARSEGWRWLLHLDPDEFACGHSPRSLWRWLRPLDPHPARRASLVGLLERVERETPTAEAVVLAPNDVLPTRRSPKPPGTPFYEAAWTLRRGAVPRPLPDPRTGEVTTLERPLGHDKGKSIVRLDAPLEPASAHRFRPMRPTDDRKRLETVHRGFHVHYVVTDAHRWWTKYRRLAEYPDRWSSGRPVAFPKQLFKELAATMTEAEATDYFERWVRVSRRSLVLPWLTGRVVHDPLVARVLDGVFQEAWAFP